MDYCMRYYCTKSGACVATNESTVTCRYHSNFIVYTIIVNFCATQSKQILVNILVIKFRWKRVPFLVVKPPVPERIALLSSLPVVIW